MGFDLSSLTSFLKPEAKRTSSKGSVLGVDIGFSTLKIVQLKDVNGVPTLETYGELQLGPYGGVDVGRGAHLPPTKITEALIDILREAGATGKNAAFALSYNSSFTTTITIPTIDQEQIDPMVPVEARKYIPIALTKVNLDWFPLSMHESEGTTDVLISAIYKEAFTRYESVMRESGLVPITNEIELFSSIRSTLSLNDDAVAILDCGASSTRMYIVKKGVIGRTHSVLLSGIELTQALEKGLQIGFKDAEELKRGAGLVGSSEDPRVQKVLTSVLERGLGELRTVMSRYEESEGVAIEKIVMSGSGALLYGLLPYVQDIFSRPVVLADPFSKVAYPAFLEDTLKIGGPSFAVAVGVALCAFQKTH